MRRPLEVPSASLGGLLDASRLVALLVALFLVAAPFDSLASGPLAVLFASLAAATAVVLWRTRTDGDGGTRLGTAGDGTSDPFADPGQAAKDRWVRAVRRLPGRDGEGD
jgi:hypothetical protein